MDHLTKGLSETESKRRMQTRTWTLMQADEGILLVGSVAMPEPTRGIFVIRELVLSLNRTLDGLYVVETPKYLVELLQ